MEKISRILFGWTVFVTVFFFSTAIAAFFYLPPWWGLGKNITVSVLVALSFLPGFLFPVFLRTIRDYVTKHQRSSIRDSLTDLYNQNAFWDFLNYEIERSKRQNYRFTLLLSDIDNFKAINDRYGHEAGDEFLKQFSILFKNIIRKGDIPARYEGDNFAAILPVCDEGQAEVVARRLLNGLRDFLLSVSGKEQIRTTASIGIAVYPDHAKTAHDLFLLAETMLKQAKTGGKDRIGIPSEDVDIGNLKSAGEKSMLVMNAIQERRIVPYFQPIVSVQGGTVLAYEVLTRIVTSERVIPAAEFIDVAESMGAVAKINYLLMEQAFRHANRNGYEGTLFLNLSPKALVMSDFLPTVKALIEEHGFKSSRIVFEITERDTVRNTQAIERNVRALRDEGFRFAIDDFGSGYATFQYIRLFNVDYLKVDGDFIRNMQHDKGMERAIVMNIASLAGNLGIKTIAEYVESESIMEHVRSTGIQYAQGYYINHPSPHIVPPAAHA